MKLQSFLVLAVGLLAVAAMASEHPVCRKKGTVVDLDDACCLEMGTWANQMADILQMIDQQQQNHHHPDDGSEMSEERGRWCDLNRLTYEEYVQCECQASARMTFIGHNVTAKCGSNEEISAESDYSCLPKACGNVNEAHILLLNETLNAQNCQITKIYGNVAPPFFYVNSQHEQKQKAKTLQLVGLLAAVALFLGGFYWKFVAKNSTKKQPPISVDEPFQDDLELTAGAVIVRTTQAEKHELT